MKVIPKDIAQCDFLLCIQYYLPDLQQKRFFNVSSNLAKVCWN